MFSPGRTFFDVSNFKLFDFDFIFVARSSNFSFKDFHSSINKISFERGPQGERGPEINFDRVFAFV